MAINPNVRTVTAPFASRTCTRCGSMRPASYYIQTRSIYFPDGYSTICNDCLKKILIEQKFSWDAVDDMCRYFDFPFVPKEFERLHESNGNDVFPIYAKIFVDAEYENFGWKDYFDEFCKLREACIIEEELPLIKEEELAKLRDKWGHNYDEEALHYLENLYDGLLLTQNVNGALQGDQAMKICKISYEIDNRIREGSDFDKVLKAYDTLVKTAEFTPKNVKNANDFDSVGELIKWLEKSGWKNKYYDGVTKDIVDETIKNIQSYNQRLYINESGIGDEISNRIENLKHSSELSNYYELQQEYDMDEFENEGFEELMSDDFNPEV